MIATSVAEMERILDFVDSKISLVEGVDYLRSTIYMRFTHVDYHKGTALAYVAKKLGLKRENIFAMGDGENDLGMLHPDFAGMLACPSNAVELVSRRIKAVQGYQATLEVSEGVVEALRHYFGNYIVISPSIQTK